MYPIGNKETIIIEVKKCFYSREIVSIIPENLRSHYFNKYIDTNFDILASQQYGACGIMEEWNAYYWGTRTSVELYDFYIDKMKE
jgi:hypothetical protein